MNDSIIEEKKDNFQTSEYIIEGENLIGIGPQLEEIIIPQDIYDIETLYPIYETNEENKKIIVGSKGNHRVKKLIMPDNVHQIWQYAFNKFINLQEVKLSNTLRAIRSNAFSECESLEEIEMPKSIRNISDQAFAYCIKLKKVVLPEKEKYIFGDMQRFIGSEVFKGCTSLEEIKIPITNTVIGERIFEDCINLKTITLEYTQKKDVLLLTEKPQKFHRIIGNCTSKEKKNKNRRKPIKIVFEGNTLSLRDKISIKRKLEKSGYCKISFKKPKKRKEETEEKTTKIGKHEKTYSKDIEILINKINKISKDYPENIKKIIKEKVNHLLDTYETNLRMLKPRIRYSDSNQIQLGNTKSIERIKPELLEDLENIITCISSNIIKEIEQLNNAKELLSESIETNYDEKDDSIEGIIKRIISHTKYLQEDRTEEIKSIIKEYIDEKINTIIEELEKRMDRKNQTSDNRNYKKELKEKLSSLDDEIKIEYEEKKPYKDLLEGLLNCKAEYKDSDKLIDLISSIKYVISKLYSNSFKRNSEEELNRIIDKYKQIITKILKNKELLQNTEYQKIEKDIREELQQLLESIQSNSYIDKHESTTANQKNLMHELMESIEILKNWEKIELDEETKKKPIKSYTIELNNKLLSTNELNENEKRETKKRVQKKLSDILQYLENEEIKTTEEYNAMLGVILRAIADVDVDLNQYIIDIKEYNKSIM